MRYLILGFLLAASVANAADVRLKITLPTTDAVGAQTPASGPGSIQSVRIEYGSCGTGNSFGSKIGETIIALPLPSPVVLKNFNPAPYCIRGYARSVDGIEGGVSGTLRYVVISGTPGVITIEAAP